MLNHSLHLRLLAVVFVISVTLSCALALGQSGRRPKSNPAPVAIPEPTPTPKKSSEPVKPALTLILGMERYAGYSTILMGTYDNVLRSCADRLDDNPAVKVEVAQREMGRGEAVKRAKAENEAYVAWLQIKVDSMGADSGSSGNLVIEYWVFAPTTAKLATSGRTYPAAYRNRGVIANPRTSGIYGDYKLEQAAREAAERILSALHHPISRRTLPTTY